MIKEIDKRNFAAFPDINERGYKFMDIANEKRINVDAGGISDLAEINSWTGNVRTLKTEKPISLEGSLITKAMSYLQNQKESFGFEETEIADYSHEPICFCD
ncbi:MAG: hypothetical protein IPL53_20700 [Ignavibacteria bacterium]|nr:hypothetical protein [Ignavibacteria bacterium]